MVSEPSDSRMGEEVQASYEAVPYISASASAPPLGQVPIVVPPGTSVSIKLNSSNYQMWRNVVQPLLNGYGLNQFIDKTESPAAFITDPQGNQSENPDYKTWWRIDQQVLGFLQSTISEQVLPYAIKAKSSREAWEALETTFAGRSQSRIIELNRKFANIGKGTMTIDEYIKNFRAVVEALEIVGHPVNEPAKIYTFLRGLPPEYSSFVISINANLDHIGFEQIVTNLKAHDDYLMHYHQGNGNGLALMANTAQRQSNHYKNNNNYSRGSRNEGWNNSQRAQNNQDRNPNFSQKAPNDQERSSNWRNRQDSNRGRGRNQTYQPRCQICSQYGHRARECQESIKLSSGSQYTRHGGQPQAFTTEQQGWGNSSQSEHNGWYPDSGATHHVTANVNNIHQPQIYEGNDQLQIGQSNQHHPSPRNS